MKRVNKHCKYFPCHLKIEDCTFCWCPFYPCLNKDLGYYIYLKNKKKKIWACDKCGVVHRKKVVDRIFKLIKNLRVSRRLLRFARNDGSAYDI